MIHHPTCSSHHPGQDCDCIPSPAYDTEPSTKDTPLVQARIYPDDAALAQGLAVETGMSVAEVIRCALAEYNSHDPLTKWDWPSSKLVTELDLWIK